MEKIKLDKKDRRILYELDMNARQPVGQIAKKVGLSKEVVGYRIKRLEKEGVIKSYYTIIDMSKLGYFSFRVYIKLLDTTPEVEDKMLDYLVKNKKVFYVAEIDGPFDVNFAVWVKNIYEFDDFYRKFKERFKKNLGEEKISIFTIAHHLHREYLLDKKQVENKIEFFGRSKEEKHDELDIRILRLVASNARVSVVEISSKLKVPERTVAFRIKQLEKKGIIQGYRALLDLGLLGYEYYKVDFVLKDISKFKELVSYAYSHPNIVYVDETIGGSDFEFDLEVKNKEQFIEIVDELRTKFPEIRGWNYLTTRRYDKLLYFPDE